MTFNHNTLIWSTDVLKAEHGRAVSPCKLWSGPHPHQQLSCCTLCYSEYQLSQNSTLSHYPSPPSLYKPNSTQFNSTQPNADQLNPTNFNPNKPNSALSNPTNQTQPTQPNSTQTNPTQPLLVLHCFYSRLAFE